MGGSNEEVEGGREGVQGGTAKIKGHLKGHKEI